MHRLQAKLAFALIAALYFAQHSEGGGLRGKTAINKKKISACLNYGHSCWGGHGKRADEMDIPEDVSWFLRRFLKVPRFQQKQQGFKENNGEIENILKSLPDDDDGRDSVYDDNMRILRNRIGEYLVKSSKIDEQ